MTLVLCICAAERTALAQRLAAALTGASGGAFAVTLAALPVPRAGNGSPPTARIAPGVAMLLVVADDALDWCEDALACLGEAVRLRIPVMAITVQPRSEWSRVQFFAVVGCFVGGLLWGPRPRKYIRRRLFSYPAHTATFPWMRFAPPARRHISRARARVYFCKSRHGFCFCFVSFCFVFVV